MAKKNIVIRKQPKFSATLQTDTYQRLINNTLGDPDRAKRFIGSITSAVAVNPALQDCEAGTILAGALLGESLNLSPSPQLGHYYLVPFKVKTKEVDMEGNDIYVAKAQFILGYKGYIQMALRSAQYRSLNVVAVKAGEFVSWNPFTEELICNWSKADNRDNLPTVGYAACYEYLNGFRKTIYWSKEKMQAHALRYSKAYKNDLNKGWNNSFWSKDFDAMAFKPMIRQLISKWGVMSVEMQQAMDADMKSIKDIGSFGDVVDTDIVDSDSSDSEVPAQPEAQPAPAVNLITCPKTEKQVNDWTCSDCEQRAGCPAWAE